MRCASAAPAFGLRDAGYYALDALRIEAGRRAWGAELSPDETPFEAGLSTRSSSTSRSTFIGRDALLRAARGAACTKRLVQFTFDDPAAFPWGGEPIAHGRSQCRRAHVRRLQPQVRPRHRIRLRASPDADTPLTDASDRRCALRDRHRRRRCIAVTVRTRGDAFERHDLPRIACPFRPPRRGPHAVEPGCRNRAGAKPDARPVDPRSASRAPKAA